MRLRHVAFSPAKSAAFVTVYTFIAKNIYVTQAYHFVEIVSTVFFYNLNVFHYFSRYEVCSIL